MSKYELSDTFCKIFFESNSEFEEIRNEVLREDNWLRNNYTQNNLIIENHSGFGVVFKKSTGQPMVMGGVYNNGKFPKNVGNTLHRLYTFPDFRMKPSEMVDGFKVACLLVDELKAVNNFEIYISTMQNRPGIKPNGFWKVWCDKMQKASNNAWTLGNGYIQSCPYMVQKCWQNFVYQETVKGAFDKWNPKTITHTEWSQLEEGK